MKGIYGGTRRNVRDDQSTQGTPTTRGYRAPAAEQLPRNARPRWLSECLRNRLAKFQAENLHERAILHDRGRYKTCGWGRRRSPEVGERQLGQRASNAFGGNSGFLTSTWSRGSGAAGRTEESGRPEGVHRVRGVDEVASRVL